MPKPAKSSVPCMTDDLKNKREWFAAEIIGEDLVREMGFDGCAMIACYGEYVLGDFEGSARLKWFSDKQLLVKAIELEYPGDADPKFLAAIRRNVFLPPGHDGPMIYVYQ